MEISSELNVCFDAVRHVLINLTDNKFYVSVRHNFDIYTIYDTCLRYFVKV